MKVVINPDHFIYDNKSMPPKHHMIRHSHLFLSSHELHQLVLNRFFREFQMAIELGYFPLVSDMDNNTAFADSLHSYDTSKKRWYWVVRVFIGVVTVIGNGLIVYIISTRARLRRKNANRFILSLCTADLFTGLFITPAECACAYKETCDRQMELAMFEFFVYASALGLCALTLDRYLAVRSPLLYQTRMPSSRVSLLITLSWMVPLLSSLLHFSYLLSDSDFRRRAMAGFAVVESLLFVALPCFVLPLVYVRILVIVRRHMRFEKRQQMQIEFNYSVASGNEESSVRSGPTQLVATSDIDGPCGSGQVEGKEGEGS